MPYTVRKIGGKYRVLKTGSGKVATNAKGTALDGGGHDSPEAAGRQIKAIEMSERKSAMGKALR